MEDSDQVKIDIVPVRMTAHKVLDQLTAVRGHAQMALVRAQKTCVREELEQIQVAADRAAALVRLSLTHLKAIEEMR